MFWKKKQPPMKTRMMGMFNPFLEGDESARNETHTLLLGRLVDHQGFREVRYPDEEKWGVHVLGGDGLRVASFYEDQTPGDYERSIKILQGRYSQGDLCSLFNCRDGSPEDKIKHLLKNMESFLRE